MGITYAPYSAPVAEPQAQKQHGEVVFADFTSALAWRSAWTNLRAWAAAGWRIPPFSEHQTSRVMRKAPTVATVITKQKET